MSEAKSDVKTFFESLSDVQRDMFLSVATDLQATSPSDKIERLRVFHNQLKAEIDQINKRREALGGVLSNVEALLRYLAAYLRDHGETFELLLFRGSLQKFVEDLKMEVAALKPEKKLAKKFDVAKRRESLMLRQALAGHLFTDILGTGGGAVKPTLTPADTEDDAVFEEDEN